MTSGAQVKKVVPRRTVIVVGVFLAIAGAVLTVLALRQPDGVNAQALVEASKAGDIDLAQSLLDQGANPNAVDIRLGSSALMWAAHEGHEDLVSLLLGRGADPDQRNPFGNTALWYAAEQGNIGTARALLRHGVRHSNPVSDTGVSAADAARKNGHDGVAELLVNASSH